MRDAGWSPADPVTLRSSARSAGSVLARRAYPTAPVSDLYYDGRRQDLAFEKPSGKSARTRHHVRFWKALDSGDDGLPVWLGAAVFDDGLGVNHYTGQITHHTAPDIDAERDLLMARQDIDLLGLLQEKTKGNLTCDEERLLEQALCDLRMRYVEVSRGS